MVESGQGIMYHMTREFTAKKQLAALKLELLAPWQLERETKWENAHKLAGLKALTQRMSWGSIGSSNEQAMLTRLVCDLAPFTLKTMFVSMVHAMRMTAACKNSAAEAALLLCEELLYTEEVDKEFVEVWQKELQQ